MIGEEVQVSKSLKRFFALFLVCALLGIFTNKLIQKTIQKSWYALNEQMLKQNVKVAAPRILFSRYGIPSFGAGIDTVSWQKPEVCRTLRILAKDIFVPIPFFELLIARPRAGAISVSHLIIEHQGDISCEKGPLISDENLDGLSDSEVTSEAENVKKLLGDQLQKYVTDIRQWRTKIPFKRLKIQKMELKNIFLGGKTLSGLGAGTVTVSDSLSLDFDFRPLTLQKESKSIATKLEIHAVVSDKEISGAVDWSYDEGHLIWTSHLDAQDRVNTKIQLSNVPLSVINRWLNTPWTFQFLWGNCTLDLKTELKRIDRDMWSASECSVKGPKGEVQVPQAQILSLRSPENLKVDVLFKDFQVDGVIKGSSELPLAGVFKKFGILSGQIYFRDKDVTSALKIEAAEVIFSKNNRRTLQEVESIDLASSYENKKWSIEITKAKLRSGEFNGSIGGYFDKTSQLWETRLDIKSLAFSPEVQEVMLGGKVSPLSLRGMFLIGAKGKMEHIDLAGNFSDAQFEGVSLTGAQFFIDRSNLSSGSIEENSLRMTLSIHRAEIGRSEQWDWFFVSLLDQASLVEKLRISRIFSETIFEKETFSVKKAFGSTLNGKVNLTANYTASLQEGTLEWILPKRHYSWDWERETGQVKLFPASEAMLLWLSENKDFYKDFQGVKIISQKQDKAG